MRTMKLENLSPNTILLIKEIFKNQCLLKLIHYNTTFPLNETNIRNFGSMFMDKIIPAPFTGFVPQEQKTILYVSFPDGQLNNNGEILNTQVYFQIVTHKNLWLIQGKNKEKLLRPLEIMTEIYRTFNNRSIKTLGRLQFTHYSFVPIDKDFNMYILKAQMMTN